jgi:hypothetical protein
MLLTTKAAMLISSDYFFSLGMTGGAKYADVLQPMAGGGTHVRQRDSKPREQHATAVTHQYRIPGRQLDIMRTPHSALANTQH